MLMIWCCLKNKTAMDWKVLNKQTTSTLLIYKYHNIPSGIGTDEVTMNTLFDLRQVLLSESGKRGQTSNVELKSSCDLLLHVSLFSRYVIFPSYLPRVVSVF